MALALAAGAPISRARDGGECEIVVSNFETPGEELPDGWREQTFDPRKIPRPSDYDLVEMDGEVVFRGAGVREVGPRSSIAGWTWTGARAPRHRLALAGRPSLREGRRAGEGG
jgi:hypothetical protein